MKVALRRKPRTRKDMVDYLSGHFRYDTMGSWNAATSYARNVKLNRLDEITKDIEDTAYDMLSVDGWERRSGFVWPLDAFQQRWNHSWQWGQNGRSGGYIVLYEGGAKPSDYQSHCTACGQRNFAKVIEPGNTPQEKLRAYVLTHNHWIPEVYPDQSEVKELGLPTQEVIEIVQALRREFGRKMPNVTLHNRCGRCGADERVNYDTPPLEIFAYPGRGVDMHADFNDRDEWSMYALRGRVDVVWDFDQAVNQAIKNFVKFCREHVVVDQVIQIPQTVKVATSKPKAKCTGLRNLKT